LENLNTRETKTAKILMKKILLLPLSLIYSFIIRLRNFLFDVNIVKSTEFEISILSVGNLTVGGTGKTPHTEFIASMLKDKFNIAVLSRGYKRKTKGFVLAKKDSTVLEIGDEAKQFSMKNPDLKVAVCEKRVAGVKKILDLDKNTEIVLLDDAFQHRKIKADISILLTDFNYPFFEDKMLPLGRLRENKSHYTRANIVVVTKCPEDLKPIDRRLIAKNINLLPFQTIYFTYLKYKELIPVFKIKKFPLNLGQAKRAGLKIILVTGIANPKLLFEYVEKNISQEIIHLKFPDHHFFNKKSIDKISETFKNTEGNNKIIITTEKDAVRLMENSFITDEIKEFYYYLEIEVGFLFDSKAEFENQIVNNIKKNRTNYQLQLSKKQF